MKNFLFALRAWILLLLIFNFRTISLSAAYLSRPELVDYNFAGATICEKAQLKIKFDHEQFNPGNVFTVEVSVNGTFSGSNLYSMTGSLSQSGNLQNVFLTVTFPAGIPAGSNYRLRVKGSNPLTYSSQLNEYPFSIAALPPSDPSYYPENYWRGYFYTWTPSISTPIPDAGTEDIFNPANYCGYICETDQSFDFNWGSNTAAPAAFADSNKVCGSMKDLFAIRMRRKINFDAGYYKFSGGADDGFRVSLDGGSTWILSDWSDHQFREISYSGSSSCGLFLDAGIRDVVVEYYENKIDARFKFSMQKTPSAADFVGLSPEYCINSPSSALFSLSPGLTGVFSGPGINANVFSPQNAGPGTHQIIYYLLGSSGSCSDTIRKTVKVYNLPDASFSGLPPVICAGGAAISLIPAIAGGSFSGPGIANGNQFSPAGLNPGQSYFISYSINQNGCSASNSQAIFIQEGPSADFSGLPDSAGSDGGIILLNPVQGGGTFSGPGILGNSFTCDKVEAPGTYEITYSISLNGCEASQSKKIRIFPVRFLIPNLLTINGDGINENWMLSGIPDKSRIEIFNRWGTRVFNAEKNGSLAWIPADDVTPGNYYYQILHPDGRKNWTGWILVTGKD